MKGAIFDLDGTLVDSMEFWSKNFIKGLDAENLSYPENVMDIVTPMGVKKAIKYMISLGSKKDEDTIYRETEAALEKDYLTVIPPKPFALDYIKKLYKQGVKMCILSASTPKMIEASTKKCGFYEYMEFAISCDEIGLSKSQPEIFTIAADKLGIDIKDIVVIDDNPTAVKTAKLAGAKSIAVYDKSNEEFIDEIKACADKFVYSLEELL